MVMDRDAQWLLAFFGCFLNFSSSFPFFCDPSLFLFQLDITTMEGETVVCLQKERKNDVIFLDSVSSFGGWKRVDPISKKKYPVEMRTSFVSSCSDLLTSKEIVEKGEVSKTQSKKARSNRQNAGEIKPEDRSPWNKGLPELV